MKMKEQARVVDLIIGRIRGGEIPLDVLDTLCQTYGVAIEVNDGQISSLVFEQEVA